MVISDTKRRFQHHYRIQYAAGKPENLHTFTTRFQFTKPYEGILHRSESLSCLSMFNFLYILFFKVNLINLLILVANFKV